MVCVSVVNDVSLDARDRLESIAAMRDLEEKFYQVPPSPCSPCFGDVVHQPQEPCSTSMSMEQDQAELFEHQRALLVKWGFNVVQHFGLPRYLVEWTMNLSDRFCHKNLSVYQDTSAWKAVVAAALHLAIKLDRGEYDRRVRIESSGTGAVIIQEQGGHTAAMRAIPALIAHERRDSSSSQQRPDSQDSSSRDLVARLEHFMLRYLGFHLHPQLSETYLSEYMQLLPLSGVDLSVSDKAMLLSRAVAIAEAAVLDCSLCCVPRSLIAQAALLNALKSISVTHTDLNLAAGDSVGGSFLIEQEQDQGMTFLPSDALYDFFSNVLSVSDSNNNTELEAVQLRLTQLHEHQQHIEDEDAQSASPNFVVVPKDNHENEYRSSPSCVVEF
jgi:hypothetical protein